MQIDGNPYCYIVTMLQCDICMKRRNRPLLEKPRVFDPRGQSGVDP